MLSAMKSITLIIGILVLISTDALAGTCDFDVKLREYAGADARDCGRVTTSDNRVSADDCVSSSLTSGSSFFVWYEQQGEDSKIQTGLSRNKNGQVSILRRDSAPCGGPGCSPTISVCRCSTVTRSDDERSFGILPVKCQDQTPLEKLCSG